MGDTQKINCLDLNESHQGRIVVDVGTITEISAEDGFVRLTCADGDRTLCMLIKTDFFELEVEK